MPYPKKAKIVEVSPRDGLQNEPTIIPTELKIQFINALSETGLRVIEATSFVSPKWVPQMADHTEVLQGIDKKPNVQYPVLTPNEKGLDDALAAGANAIAVFTAASETFSQKNTNSSIKESLQNIQSVITKAKQHECWVRGYVSCILGCPYEGDIDPHTVVNIAEQLLNMGCDEISLGDTIGVGTPDKTQELMALALEKIPLDKLAVHFHDTHHHALDNIRECLNLGIHIIDSSAGGLGGCPYAPGASGNVATESVLDLLKTLNIETGIDPKKLLNATAIIQSFLNP